MNRERMVEACKHLRERERERGEETVDGQRRGDDKAMNANKESYRRTKLGDA